MAGVSGMGVSNDSSPPCVWLWSDAPEAAQAAVAGDGVVCVRSCPDIP